MTTPTTSRARPAAFRSPLAVLMALALGAIAGCATTTNNTADADASADRAPVLDGTEKSILVNGYSTSYAWPDMLQDMLDEHAGDRRVYHVVNSVIGGAPVESWIAEPGTRDHARTVEAMHRDFTGPNPRLLGDAPRPNVAICQQSLQLTRDDRGPVKSDSDMVGAEMGADAMQELAAMLHNDHGIERVIIATHIYKEPVEPEVGNERIALDRLISRGIPYIEAGPDVWQPTHDTFPESFEDDRLHPNEMGMKVMAEHWYRHLAGPDAREDVIARMWDRDYDVDTMMRDYLAWRRDG